MSMKKATVYDNIEDKKLPEIQDVNRPSMTKIESFVHYLELMDLFIAISPVKTITSNELPEIEWIELKFRR